MNLLGLVFIFYFKKGQLEKDTRDTRSQELLVILIKLVRLRIRS